MKKKDSIKSLLYAISDKSDVQFCISGAVPSSHQNMAAAIISPYNPMDYAGDVQSAYLVKDVEWVLKTSFPH